MRLSVFLLGLFVFQQAQAKSQLEEHLFLSISPHEEQCGTPKVSNAERQHAAITEGIQRSSLWLDNYFGDDRSIESLAHSVVRLGLDGDYVESEPGETKLRLRGKIDLPRLQQRLQLVFEGEPEEEDISGLDNQEASASLRYKFKDTLLRETSLSAGFRGGVSEPRIFLRARSSRVKKRNDSLARFTPSLGYDSNTGWESTIRFDIEHHLSIRDLIRITTQPEWQEDSSGIIINQSFSYFYRFSRRSYLATDWLTTIPTRPSTKIEVSRIRIRYRRDLWKNKLFLEIAPGVRFTETNNYLLQWELGSKLEMVFAP